MLENLVLVGEIAENAVSKVKKVELWTKMPSFKFLVPFVLPLIEALAEKQEVVLLQVGIPLTTPQLRYAEQIGVCHPDRIRLVISESIPVPQGTIWEICAYLHRLVFPKPIGFALGYGIYIQTQYQDSQSVLIHELVHVAQYERFENLRAFIKGYLNEVFQFGYRNAPLEQEARQIEESLCVAQLINKERK